MPNPLFKIDVLSIRDLSLDQIHLVLDLARQFKKNLPEQCLSNKIIAHCFFEPSTRTRLSFEAASLRLGAQNICFSGAEQLSISKGEDFSDTIKTISYYADLIVLRHPKENTARLAAEISSKPVINAGDGSNQHPTQALADLMTIQETQGRIDHLSIALVGDLKYGRAVHSLVQACALFNNHLFFISSSALGLPEALLNELKHRGSRYSFHADLDEIIDKVDILYMTRTQRERFSESELASVQAPFVLTLEKLKRAQSHLKVLHPLPRTHELEKTVDQSPHAAYFQQVENAVYIRQALLALLLKETIHHGELHCVACA